MADTLRHVGAQMANVMFNLAQRPGEQITGDIVATMDSLCKRWDAAVRAARSPNAASEELLNMLGRVHPYAMPVDEFKRAEDRLERAVNLQQPLPVPDQAAIVWRGDLMSLMGELQHKRSVWLDWKKMRAALASRPVEVDDEGLPPLPDPVLLFAPDVYGYTGDSMRQGQRDAVAAYRARLATGGAQ
ncbi:hypothetical protein RCH14_000455 [Massilia sp. MP_M2]|uniref:hypothetical protein n=1 Tax=Massilia sp. MP_M2 TaxID=3071713 RepID=UPI00319EAAE2